MNCRRFRLAVFADSSDYAEDASGPGHYISHWGTVNTGGFWGDMAVNGSSDPDWEKTDMDWAIVPWGFRKLILWVQARYRWGFVQSLNPVQQSEALELISRGTLH